MCFSAFNFHGEAQVMYSFCASFEAGYGGLHVESHRVNPQLYCKINSSHAQNTTISRTVSLVYFLVQSNKCIYSI